MRYARSVGRRRGNDDQPHRHAAQKVKGILEQEKESIPAGGLRIYVQGGGCSGFQYGMVLDEVADGDQVFEKRRHQGHRRSDEPALPRRRRGRLQGRPDGRRLRHQEPERHVHLRLRPLVHDRATLRRRRRRSPALRPGLGRTAAGLGSRVRLDDFHASLDHSALSAPERRPLSARCRCRSTSSSRAIDKMVADASRAIG